MSKRVPVLSATALAALASAAERGLLIAPFAEMQVGRQVPTGEVGEAVHVLEGLAASGLEGRGLAAALRLAAGARRAGDERPEAMLVWSDLDLQGSRDTAVVCDQMFREAQHSVLLSTFSLGHKARADGQKGNPVFRTLAKRMAEVDALQVRLFFNLKRPEWMSGASAQKVEEQFVSWFRHELWPWDRVPELFYDPRSLDEDSDEPACLHAKCVLVDDRHAFVSSANLTEAAQQRNIEAGVLLDDPVFARRLRRQFESLIDRGYVRHLPCG